MKFPLTRVERTMIFAGCGIIFCGGIAFFAKLILFPGIGYGFIGSLWALGSMLISATVLGHYEAIDDMKEELGSRGKFSILPADHPLQQINENDPILNDRRFTRSGERNFPDREAPDPQPIVESGDPRAKYGLLGGTAFNEDAPRFTGNNRSGKESDAHAPRIFPNGTQGPDLEFEEEVVHQRYAPVECGPLAPLSLAHTGTRLLSRGGLQVGGGGDDDFGVIDDEEPVDGFEAFRAHLPMKGAERKPASAAK